MGLIKSNGLCHLYYMSGSTGVQLGCLDFTSQFFVFSDTLICVGCGKIRTMFEFEYKLEKIGDDILADFVRGLYE